MEHAPTFRDAWALYAPSVTVETERNGRHVVLRVHGEADAETSDSLRAALLSALEGGPASVRVDVSDLSFCDLAGSDALHDFADAAAARAVAVDLQGMTPLLRVLYTEFSSRRARIEHD